MLAARSFSAGSGSSRLRREAQYRAGLVVTRRETLMNHSLNILMSTPKFLRCFGVATVLAAPATVVFAHPGEDSPREARRGGEGHRPHASELRQLGRLWHDLSELESSAMPLSKAQAARIVDLTLPWTRQSKMSEAQAKKLATQLESVLTTSQKTHLYPQGLRPRRQRDSEAPPRSRGIFGGDEAETERSGFGRGRGAHSEEMKGGRDERRGKQGPRGLRNEAKRGFFASFNPLYPPTGYVGWKNLPEPVQQRTARHYNEFRATLEALSRKARS
jgi:hypothetical protein